MTNKEKYQNEIAKYMSEGFSEYCKHIVERIILPQYEMVCEDNCYNCIKIQLEWGNKEYKEPKIDWVKVAIDTPVLVRDSDGSDWHKRYFAKYQDGKIFTYNYGCTSWSANGTTNWKQGKLADEAK